MPPQPLQQRQPHFPHPSNSHGQPYSQDMRDLVMALIANGQINSPMIQQLRNQQRVPSRSTICRWRNLTRRLGHYRACRRNGNVTASILRGHNLVLTALYRLIFPKAQHAEINAFLYRANFGNHNFRFYSASQLSKAESNIKFTTKRGSSTAYEAYLPINVLKRERFWNLPYPHGIADIRRQDMIDCDEAGVNVKSADRKRGKAHSSQRVNQEGPYGRGGDKLNVMMGISGEDGTAQQPSRRWRTMWLDGGTTVHRVMNFVNMVIADIGPGNAQRRYCFLMDNLSAHHNRAVAAIIHAAGHRLVFRAPYYPVDGPIEFVFNTLQCLVRSNLHNVRNTATLMNEVGNAIQSIDDFSNYFINCGYWRN